MGAAAGALEGAFVGAGVANVGAVRDTPEYPAVCRELVTAVVAAVLLILA